MARFVLRGSILRKILAVASCVLVCACLRTSVALAQHGGGHFSSGGLGASHVSAPPSSHPKISRPRVSAGPPLAGAGSRNFRVRPLPIRPSPPVFPIYGYPFFFGSPFLWLGGFNSFWWQICDPFWGWGFGCNTLPFYGYGFGNYVPFYSPGGQGTPTYEYPLYPYGEEGRELPQLYLKDGTVYKVTDYWLVDGQIHFTTLEEDGTKSVEHVIDFNELDLQRTIDVNTQQGFRFVLRNEPLEQYLQDHPDPAPPVGPPPRTAPPAPLPSQKP